MPKQNKQVVEEEQLLTDGGLETSTKSLLDWSTKREYFSQKFEK